MAYWQWGDSQASEAILCAHGLGRQGRDFSVLARHLCERAQRPIQVIAVDVVGRGRSDWLTDPTGYQFQTYCADMVALAALLAVSGVRHIDWVGTSMGGVIGTVLAGTKMLPVPIRRLVLNDVGPVTQWVSIERIRSYLGKAPDFNSPAEADAYLREISSGFGPHSDDQWRALNAPMVHPAGDGRWRLHYDRNIAAPLAVLTAEALMQGEAALWAMYDSIRVPTLLLRGAESDLLNPQTAKAMSERGPHARLVEFAGVGHAPTLVAADQLAVLEQFLLNDSSP